MRRYIGELFEFFIGSGQFLHDLREFFIDLLSFADVDDDCPELRRAANALSDAYINSYP